MNYKIRIIILVVSIFLMNWCKDASEFTEYPPNLFLSEKNQNSLVNRFVFSVELVDSTSDIHQLEALHKMYKLRYFVQKDSSGYFMISRSAHFLSSGVEYIGGNVNKDSTFDVRFRAEVPTYFTTDSVKQMFTKILYQQEERMKVDTKE